MYYISKFLQAAGLALVLFGFLIKFPRLMDTKLLGLGIVIFLSGWLLQNYGLRK